MFQLLLLLVHRYYIIKISINYFYYIVYNYYYLTQFDIQIKNILNSNVSI